MFSVGFSAHLQNYFAPITKSPIVYIVVRDISPWIPPYPPIPTLPETKAGSYRLGASEEPLPGDTFLKGFSLSPAVDILVMPYPPNQGF